MKKLNYLLLLIIIGLVVIVLKSNSIAAQKSFVGVVPFTTVGGLMGFFDQNNGKVYLYDGNLKNCVFVSQVEELGEQMQEIKK